MFCLKDISVKLIGPLLAFDARSAIAITTYLPLLVSFIIKRCIIIVLEEFLPRGFETNIRIRSLFLAVMIGSIGSIVFCLPVLQNIRKVQPLSLFNAHVEAGKNFKGLSFMNLLSYLPLLMTYWFLGVWQSKSYLVGTLFMALLLACIFVLGVIGLGMVKFTEIFGNIKSPFVRLALKNLSRNRLSAVSCFMAISIGTLLINLVPQIQQGLLEEISKPKNFKLPSLFLFDIQTEQIESLNNTLAENKYFLDMLSPMVRGRFMEVNG